MVSMKIQFPPAVVKIGIVFLLINLAIGWATGTNSGYLWVSRIYAGKPGWKFKAHDGVELSDNMLPREFQHQAGIAGFFFSGTNIVACVRRETVETYPVDLGVDYKFDKALIFLGSAGSCFF